MLPSINNTEPISKIYGQLFTKKDNYNVFNKNNNLNAVVYINIKKIRKFL